eukprot:2306206-Prymnesium_polylepis.1
MLWVTSKRRSTLTIIFKKRKSAEEKESQESSTRKRGRGCGTEVSGPEGCCGVGAALTGYTGRLDEYFIASQGLELTSEGTQGLEMQHLATVKDFLVDSCQIEVKRHGLK